MSDRPPSAVGSGEPKDYAAGMASTMQMLLGMANRPIAAKGVPASVPLTVVTGFLGAGKTTLMNAVLADPGGRRVAVIVNDFGSVAVDAALIRERSARAISLSNGCVCCSLASGLATTLGGLLALADPPDAILLETSGIAEPDGVVHAALQQPEVRLNAIIGMLDCDRTPELLRDGGLQRLMGNQMSRADIVLLNKSDIAPGGSMDQAEHWVKEVTHPRTRLIRTIHARLPADIVLGEPRHQSFLLADGGMPRHDDLFESCTVRHDGALDARRLAELAGTLPDWVLRAKGLVLLRGVPPRPVAVQVAGRRWSFTEMSRLPGDGADPSRMIAIGRRGEVDAAALQAAFTRCAAPA